MNIFVLTLILLFSILTVGSNNNLTYAEEETNNIVMKSNLIVEDTSSG